MPNRLQLNNWSPRQPIHQLWKRRARAGSSYSQQTKIINSKQRALIRRIPPRVLSQEESGAALEHQWDELAPGLPSPRAYCISLLGYSCVRLLLDYRLHASLFICPLAEGKKPARELREFFISARICQRTFTVARGKIQLNDLCKGSEFESSAESPFYFDLG